MAVTSFFFPTSYQSPVPTGVSAETNLGADDGAVANIGYNLSTFWMGGFGITGIPAGSTIDGIEVLIDDVAGSDSSIGSFSIALSYNGGSNYTAGKSSGPLSPTTGDITLGGASDPWGRTWTISELSDGNFRLRITSSINFPEDVDIDSIQVRVHYTEPSTDTSDERDAKLIGIGISNDNRSGHVAGGDGRYVETFDTTDKKDEANTTGQWDGDGIGTMNDT